MLRRIPTLLALVLALEANASESCRIVLEGLDRELKENVMAHLGAAREGESAASLARRLQIAAADGLRALGYYEPDIRLAVNNGTSAEAEVDAKDKTACTITAHIKAGRRVTLLAPDIVISGEAADDLTALQLHGRLAALRALDQDGEILSPFRVCADMGAAGIPRGPGGVEPVLIAVAGRHDTVGGHKDGAPESLEFLLLLPPGVPIIAREMGILFKGRIVMGRQHLRVGVYVYAGSRRLLQQHFQIL